MNAMSQDQDSYGLDGWQERLGDPGTTLPRKVEPADRGPVWLAFFAAWCAVALALLVAGKAVLG